MSHRHRPQVSVVIPCYDVERYVDECLESVTSQTLAEIEIVCVDDGSCDDTGAILAHWAQLDARIRVVTQSNAGLGAARNAGVDVACGTFLFFLDSDDLLPHDALERMVASADATNADIVSGAADQFTDTDRWRAVEYGSIFDRDRQGLHVDRCSELVRDQMACSKLFRSSFWERHELRFPEATLYEDIEVVVRAHWLAGSVDLISSPTYLWRRRDPSDASITQDRYRPGSVSARFAALSAADHFLHQNAHPVTWAAHGEKICNVDVRIYAHLIADAPLGWSEEFLDYASRTLENIESGVWERLSTPMMIVCRSMLAGDATGVTAAVPMLSRRGRRSSYDVALGAATLALRRPRLLASVARHRRLSQHDPASRSDRDRPKVDSIVGRGVASHR